MGITARLLLLAAPLLEVAPAPPAYRLEVRLDPPSGSIDALVEIDSPNATAFSLSPELSIRSIEADGRPAAYQETPAPTPGAPRTVTLATPLPGRLRIAYGGRLRLESSSSVLRQVNGIHPERVELASYASWVPRLPAGRPFSFRLAVDVPAGFVTVTNGRLASESTAAGRTRTEWEHAPGAGDVALLAAPGLRRSVGVRNGVTVDVLASRLADEELDATRDEIARAVEALVRLVGAPLPSPVLRVAYAPRPGWGYVRSPLVLMSEESALSLRGQPFGRARDMRYVAHEVAHSWWHRADAATPDDWINEGLSEYSAYLVAEELVGHAFARTLLEEYEGRSDDSATVASIAETPNGSPDREVNRYARPVLLLEDARRRHGDGRLVAFLLALQRRFSTGPATTSTFLEEVEASLGREERDRFAEALYRTDWAASAPPPLAVEDEVFLGRWSGTLVQGGSATAVLLDLASKDGALVATLASPDPGASHIPVPSARVGAGSLAFGVGAFGIRYRGRLTPDRHTIEGVWTQGGIATPLRLVREGPVAED
jgi:hypothetical protein